MKSIFKRGTAAVIAFVVVLGAVFAAYPISNALAASEPTYAQPYPWSKVAGGTTGDYIADSYNNVGPDHVFEPVTQERLLDILSSSGNYYIVFGDPEHGSSQSAISAINDQAKANGITKIYHFDPFVDGYQMDITNSDTIFQTSNGLPVSQLWSRIIGLLPSGEPLSSYNSRDTLLFLYNRDSASPIRSFYSFKESSVFDLSSEKTKITDVFKGGSIAGSVIPGSTRSDFAFFKRTYNGFATYFNYNNGNGPDTLGNRTGAESTELFTGADEEGFALHQITFGELLNLFNSPGKHIILFGASWCHNTQAVIGSIGKKAKEYGQKTVYVYDTTLGNQLTFGTGSDIDKVTGASSAFNSRNSVVTSTGRGNISYMYGELARYLGNFITENNTKKNNSIAYYPNGDLSGTATSAAPWESGTEHNAIRLQMPFLIEYDKDKADPVTKGWIHKNAANDGTYTEYMLELAWVLKTPNAIAAGGNIDGLSKVDIAAEAIAALDSVLRADPLISFTSVAVPRITGSVKVGRTLKVNTGNWSPAPDFTYQWYADGKKIQGAVQSTYKVTASDLGRKIKAQVTGSLTGYTSQTKTSAETAKVISDFKASGSPAIIGTAKVGKILKVRVGKWSPAPKFTYQWYTGSKKIKGATKAQYKISRSLKGKKIKVRVIAKKTNYVTVTKTSTETKKVKG